MAQPNNIRWSVTEQDSAGKGKSDFSRGKHKGGFSKCKGKGEFSKGKHKGGFSTGKGKGIQPAAYCWMWPPSCAFSLPPSGYWSGYVPPPPPPYLWNFLAHSNDLGWSAQLPSRHIEDDAALSDVERKLMETLFESIAARDQFVLQTVTIAGTTSRELFRMEMCRSLPNLRRFPDLESLLWLAYGKYRENNGNQGFQSLAKVKLQEWKQRKKEMRRLW